MPPLLAYILITLAGLAFGSFLNVCIVRLPRGESVAAGRSNCPRCGAQILARDNVPLLSFALLRGRCRACGERIAWRYPLVEAAVAVCWVLCAVKFGWTVVAAKMAVFCWLAIGPAAIDAEVFLLPDVFTLGGTMLALVFAAAEGWRRGNLGGTVLFRMDMSARAGAAGAAHNVLATALAALAAFAIVWLIRFAYRAVRKREGMGLGDAKLMAMIAAFLGLPMAALTFVVGIFAAVAGVLVLHFTGRDVRRDTRLPMGSFWAASGIVCGLFGGPVLAWYLGLLR